MKTQKKQNLLNAIIVILVIALIMMIASIIYEENVNRSKQLTHNTSIPTTNKEIDDEEINNENEENTESEEENDNSNLVEEPDINVEEEIVEKEDVKEENKYVGVEENETSKEPEISTDDKVINLVKEEWGEAGSVNVTIEKKNGNKYRVAVRDNSTTVLAWYEVNIETWEVSEY